MECREGVPSPEILKNFLVQCVQKIFVFRPKRTGVNPAGDAGDTSPIFFGWGDVNGNIPPILLRTFGYSRTILVALRSFSLKPISFGYKTPQIRFSQAGGQSAHKARPPTLNSR